MLMSVIAMDCDLLVAHAYSMYIIFPRGHLTPVYEQCSFNYMNVISFAYKSVNRSRNSFLKILLLLTSHFIV